MHKILKLVNKLLIFYNKLLFITTFIVQVYVKKTLFYYENN